MDFVHYKTLIRAISLGKHLPDAVYLHVSTLSQLDPALHHLLNETIAQLQVQQFEYDVIKFFKRDFKISLLSYPQFFTQAFPILHASCTLDLSKGTARIISFLDSDNPPILHRKETMLLTDHPDLAAYCALTQRCEQVGLFKQPKTIGFKRNWERLLARHGLQLVDEQLVPIAAPIPPALAPTDTQTAVLRHKTAIRRYALSKPMQTLAQHAYLNGDYSVFDYGCGQGDDLRELQAHGLQADGFDPVFAPDAPKRAADVVNLGFVINVIENPKERAACLHDAFELAQRVLVVAAMLGNAATLAKFEPFGDGVLTQRNTFQKYYSQSELKAYLETTLACNAIAVAPGIFYIFKDALDEQIFLANRFRVRREWQQLSRPAAHLSSEEQENVFAKHRALYDFLWQTLLALGRYPVTQELAEQMPEIKQAFGSLRKALDTVINFSGATVFAQAQQARRDDLLVYFALEKFSGRKPYTHLPDGLKRDVKALFGDYKTAQTEATALLFSTGKPEIIFNACEQAQQLGYLQAQQALTLHVSQLGYLPPVLRVYVGCATQLYGDVESADLIKLHIRSGKVSLMRYQAFAEVPLPELQERIKIKLRTQEIDFFDYGEEYQPQPLYLKSRYIPPDFPNYEKQCKFDEKLLKTELFDLSGFGPSRDAFYAVLAEHCLAVRGFQLIKKRAGN